jgi:hypothetical protein
MDVSKLTVAMSAAMHVRNAAGVLQYEGGKPVQIIFHSPASRAFAEMETRQNERTVKRHNENEGKVVARSADERRVEAVEDLVDLTIGFENLTFGELSGRDLFAAVYRDPGCGFIVQQANKFLNDWGNFTPASPTS